MTPALAQLRAARGSGVALLDTLYDRGVPVLDTGRAAMDVIATLTSEPQREAFTRLLDVLNDAITIAIPPTP